MEQILHPEPTKPPNFDQRLAALDKNVRVVWSPQLGVWEVQELGRVTKRWRYVMLWAIVNPPTPPKYVALPSPERVMEKLHEIDVTRLGATPMAQWAALCAEMDDKRRDRLAKHFAEIDAAGREYSRDMLKRHFFGKTVFGPGSVRGKGNYGSGSPHMRKFMADRSAEMKVRAPIRPDSGHS